MSDATQPGWGGDDDIQFCALDSMSDATQHDGLGWVGVGMMTFCALGNLSDATQDHGLRGGVGMMTLFCALDNGMLRNIIGWGGLGWK